MGKITNSLPLLSIKPVFLTENRQMKTFPYKLKEFESVTIDSLRMFKNQIDNLIDFWKSNNMTNRIIVTVRYKRIVPKSNMLCRLLAPEGHYPYEFIVGARYDGNGDERCSVVTYSIEREVLHDTLVLIENIISEFEQIESKYIKNEGIVTGKELELISKDHLFKYCKRSDFQKVLFDCNNVEAFYLSSADFSVEENSIVSIFDTNTPSDILLTKCGIKYNHQQFDKNTFIFTPEQFTRLKSVAPYLISMSTSDLCQMVDEPTIKKIDKSVSIQEPKNEPIIGVIDTLFSHDVYFSKWVEAYDLVDSTFERRPNDYEHGTCVTSLIVDAVSLNPELEDGCGHFRVRHFGVALYRQMSSYSILNSIEKIVNENPDIKVWNLSLGSKFEIEKNSVSIEAAFLDKLQNEKDIVFVVAGTNLEGDEPPKRIGPPADSVNSVVVGAVNKNGEHASYSRIGVILDGNFVKPDVGYYGGDGLLGLRLCGPKNSIIYKKGTSFAAPLISRKIAYLIHVMDFNREIAKAMIIHSCINWDKGKRSVNCYYGYGIVPKRIEEILTTPQDEIRFFVQGVSKTYDTYFLNLPVPFENGKTPFKAHATLCYYPQCNRSHGVEYTNVELGVKFGIVKQKSIKGITKYYVESIDKNEQGDEGFHNITEIKAKNEFHKWNNVKNLSDSFSDRSREKSVGIEKGYWGLSVKATERFGKEHNRNTKFGLIVTLKEINGKNRWNEFVTRCQFAGITVKPIDVKSRIDVYNIAEEDVELI